jgi:hypothetical protein
VQGNDNLDPVIFDDAKKLENTKD